MLTPAPRNKSRSMLHHACLLPGAELQTSPRLPKAHASGCRRITASVCAWSSKHGVMRATTSALRALPLPLASCAASCSSCAKSAREQASKGFVIWGCRQRRADGEEVGGRAAAFEGCSQRLLTRTHGAAALAFAAQAEVQKGRGAARVWDFAGFCEFTVVRGIVSVPSTRFTTAIPVVLCACCTSCIAHLPASLCCCSTAAARTRGRRKGAGMYTPAVLVYTGTSSGFNLLASRLYHGQRCKPEDDDTALLPAAVPHFLSCWYTSDF